MFTVSHLIRGLACPFHHKVHKNNNISIKENPTPDGVHTNIEIQCMADWKLKVVYNYRKSLPDIFRLRSSPATA